MKNIINAIHRMYSDTTKTREEVLEMLETIEGEVEILIETLKEEE